MGLDPNALPLELRAVLELADTIRRLPGVNDIDRRGPSLFDPHIWGIEVSQAIQYYEANRHLSDPADRGPDNSVRLIAKKPCWVRVYLRSGLLGASTNVTGELVVERASWALLKWSPVVTLNPQVMESKIRNASAIARSAKFPDQKPSLQFIAQRGLNF